MRAPVCAALLGLFLAGCSLLRSRPPEYRDFELASGLVVRDLVVPEKGALVAEGDSVTVHYSLSLADRTPVESSRDLGQPVSFRVGAGSVPRGLELGVVGMRLFGQRRLRVPSELAFGAAGRPPRVPPDADVVFELEVMEHAPAGG